MKKNILIYLRAGLAAFIVLVSSVIVLTIYQNSQSARILARQSLESTALSLSVSAENALRLGADSQDRISDVFSDRVIAYAFVASKQGKILFHTNRRLAGAQLPESETAAWLSSGTVSSRPVVLGTGIPAYEFNFIIQSGPEPRLLRLALNTYPADAVIARADRMWWAGGAVLLVLWAMGLLFERTLTRYMHVRDRMEKQESLALIGRMTTVLAHEIRNSLGAVKGFSQLLAEGIEEGDSRRPAVSSVIRGAQRIEELVNDMLMFSRDEKYELEKVDALDIVNEAAGAALQNWKGEARIDIGDGLAVLADREKLFRVLVNGIKNAREAAGSEGLVRISGGPSGARAHIAIEDSGAGIDPADLPRLFSPFFTTKAAGTGLGLAYSKKVIEGMNGEITLSNGAAGGAVLRITLPGSS
jgi:signal transduction histidine kinase